MSGLDDEMVVDGDSGGDSDGLIFVADSTISAQVVGQPASFIRYLLTQNQRLRPTSYDIKSNHLPSSLKMHPNVQEELFEG